MCRCMANLVLLFDSKSFDFLIIGFEGFEHHHNSTHHVSFFLHISLICGTEYYLTKKIWKHIFSKKRVNVFGRNKKTISILWERCDCVLENNSLVFSVCFHSKNIPNSCAFSLYSYHNQNGTYLVVGLIRPSFGDSLTVSNTGYITLKNIFFQINLRI